MWNIAGMNFPLNERKVADAMARLIEKSGVDVDYLRLCKLAYLADRQALIRRGVPIIGGHYFSMRKGPTIGEVMNCVATRKAPNWDALISIRKGNDLNLLVQPSYESLSQPELEILDAVVEEHYNQSTKELVEWCHDNCPEYEHVIFGRKSISIETILQKEGKSPSQVRKIADLAEELTEMDRLLA